MFISSVYNATTTINHFLSFLQLTGWFFDLETTKYLQIKKHILTVGTYTFIVQKGSFHEHIFRYTV